MRGVLPVQSIAHSVISEPPTSCKEQLFIYFAALMYNHIYYSNKYNFKNKFVYRKNLAKIVFKYPYKFSLILIDG